jgi:predicted enzyme related to lactoylglutathione lyase
LPWPRASCFLRPACEEATMTADGPPDGGQVQLGITFFYYRDLPAALAFYESVLGVSVTIDQGWCKICALNGGACVGLVDESRGSHRAHDIKPVQLCLRVPDVDAWHAWAMSKGVPALGPLKSNEALGIRAFTFNDPEGYQIEVQSPTRPGA